MPIYAYECSACKKTFEVEQRITAGPITDCPCGAAGTLRRLVEPIAVMFKGSGFYINDSVAPVKAETPAAAPAASTAESSPAESASAAPAVAPTAESAGRGSHLKGPKNET